MLFLRFVEYGKNAKIRDINFFEEVEEPTKYFDVFEHHWRPSQSTRRDKSIAGNAGSFSNNSNRCPRVPSEIGRKNTQLGMLSNDRQPGH